MQDQGAYGVHAHSEVSKRIVKQMIVGWTQGQQFIEDISTTVQCKYSLNDLTATFVMQSEDNRTI